MTASRRGSRLLRQFFVALGQDIGWGLRELLVNRIAGYLLVPRVVRFVLYRVAGLRVRTANIYPDTTFVGSARITIGAGTFINRYCYFEAVEDITIGADVQIAMHALFVTSTHRFDSEGGFERVPTGRPIRIGDRCWIGARATILPGVTIGDDVVVAAGAVVAKDCAPGGLYGGVPAVRIRDLFPNETLAEIPAAVSVAPRIGTADAVARG